MLETIMLWIPPVAALVIAILVGKMFRNYAVKRMSRSARRTKTDVDDLTVESVRRYVPLWFFLGGVAVAAQLAPISVGLVGTIVRLCGGIFILTLTLMAANVLTAIAMRQAARRGGAGDQLRSSSMLPNVVRGAVIAIGVLIILQQFIDIAPLLGLLWVAALVVGLALLPTLSNLFAGMYVTLSRTLRIGDFVELENGTQGTIVDVGWRAAKLRDGTNNLVNVPNARLVEMVSKNYSLSETDDDEFAARGSTPGLEQIIKVPISVSYSSDLDQVETVTLAVAREVLAYVPEGMPDHDPVVRFQNFGSTGIDFYVALRARQPSDRSALVHAFMKRLKARYELEGIEIPFTQHVQQVVHQLDV